MIEAEADAPFGRFAANQIALRDEIRSAVGALTVRPKRAPHAAFVGERTRRSGHLRSISPIESPFATGAYGTRATKGAGSKAAALAMAYKLLESAQERRNAGTQAMVQRPRALVADVLPCVKSKDGIEVTGDDTTTQDKRVAA